MNETLNIVFDHSPLQRLLPSQFMCLCLLIDDYAKDGGLEVV